MELSTSEVGCLCQGSLQELVPSMAALEGPLGMDNNLPMVDNSLLMVDNNKQDMELSLLMGDNNLAMEVKEVMAKLDFQTLGMGLDS